MAGAAAGGAASRQDGGAAGAASPGGITAEGLRETFPQWRIFRSRGNWWAARGGLVRWEGPESLRRRVITAPDLAGLAERLCLQEHLDGLDEAALAAIYRDMSLPGPAR
jgi:hypothetical protein